MILTETSEIGVCNLPKNVINEQKNNSDYSLDTSSNLSIKYHTRNIEEELIKKALEKTAGNRTHAAKLLEISHRALLYKIKSYKIEGKSKRN